MNIRSRNGSVLNKMNKRDTLNVCLTCYKVCTCATVFVANGIVHVVEVWYGYGGFFLLDYIYQRLKPTCIHYGVGVEENYVFCCRLVDTSDPGFTTACVKGRIITVFVVNYDEVTGHLQSL